VTQGKQRVTIFPHPEEEEEEKEEEEKEEEEEVHPVNS